VLFVLALCLGAPRIDALGWQIGAFTLAHCVTLVLGVLGWVRVAPDMVAALAAATLVVIAVEIARTDQPGRWRLALVFACGLLHGLGFANALTTIGWPTGLALPALAGFVIGLELGQIVVVGSALAVVGVWFGSRPWYRQRIVLPASGALAVIGLYWCVERVFL